MQHIDPAQLAYRLAQPDTVPPLLLDVREPAEWAICRIDGALLMSMRSVPARLDELRALGPDREIVCICHHGARSAQVGYFLERNGFDKVINLSGGIDAWAALVEPQMPRY